MKKTYIEIQRNTDTFAQFLAQCRSALRNNLNGAYAGWVDYVDGAREEMDSIANGEREAYYHKHRADEERQFDELCACSATSYQIYYRHESDGSGYNFNLEWDGDGNGYFFCVDTMMVAELTA